MDYHARLYEPWIGRFVSPDTIVADPTNPADLNRYSYTRNNPIMYTDPSGHDPQCFDTPGANCTYHVNNNTVVRKTDTNGDISVTMVINGKVRFTHVSGRSLHRYSSTRWHPLLDPDAGNNTYSYVYDLGSARTPTNYMALLRDNCQAVFSISGCQNGFDTGDTMNLDPSAPLIGVAPVRVTEVTESSFSLVALDGHPEGAGRRISFEFCCRGYSRTTLRVTGQGPGSWLVNWPIASQLNRFVIAGMYWSRLAANLAAPSRVGSAW